MPNPTCPEILAYLPQHLHTRSQANHLRLCLIRERNFPPEIFTSSIRLADGTPCWIIARSAEPTTSTLTTTQETLTHA